MNFQRKYGTASVIRIPLVKAGSANHAVSGDWTPAAGDVKISKDGGAWANVTNLPTATTVGNAATWAFSLTATEMQAAIVEVEISDAATKAVEDDHFQLETYGNASANLVFDLSAANVTLANVAHTIASLTVSGAGGVSITNTTAGGAGLSVTGNTTGAGILATGGASGDGLKAVGGGTTGGGINAVATAGNNAGLSATGVGTGAGILGTGGASGSGLKGVAGGTAGHGMQLSATAATYNGLSSTGVGSGAGILATGGTTGHGLEAVGTGSGKAGLSGVNTSAGGRGIAAQGADGLWAASNVTGGSGLNAIGLDAGHGISASIAGAPTGNGMYLTNSAGTGKALVATPTTTDIGGGTAPTVAQIWEEALASHSGVAGSMANKLNAVALDSTVAKTAGSVASVTGAVASVTGAVGSVTGSVGSVVGITAADIGTIKTNVGTPVALDGGVATLAGMVTKVAGTGFVESTDALHNLSTKITTGTPASVTASGAHTLTTGTLISGTYTDTVLSDGTNLIFAPVTPAVGGFGLNLYLPFVLTSGQSVNTVTIRGFFNAGAARFTNVYAYNWVTLVFDQLSDSVSRMNNATTNATYNYTLLPAHQDGSGNVRISFKSPSVTVGDRLNIDQIYVSVAVAGPTTGQIADAVYLKMKTTVYSGAIWVDTVSGFAGTDIGVHGLQTHPVLTLADALTLASSLGVKQLNFFSGSSVTLTSSMAGWNLNGPATIALNGQDITGTHFVDSALISGVGVGTIPEFMSCDMDGCTIPAGTDLHGCALKSTITLGAAGDYLFDACFSKVAGDVTANSPVVDFGASGAQNLSVRHYAGGIKLQNMTSLDKATVAGTGIVILMSGCTGGTVAIRGTFELTDQASGAVTVIDTARWAEDQNVASVTGSVGSVTGLTASNLDATVSSRSTYAGGAVASVTGAVGSVTGSVGSVTGAVGSVTGNVGGNVTGSVGSVVGSVGSVVGLTASNLDATVSSRSTYAGGAVTSVTGDVGGNLLGNVGGNVVGSVASVTGNVGGNVVGTVGSVTGDRAKYMHGAVWVDTVLGTAGTGAYFNGTVTVPSLTLADAKTIADSLKLKRFWLQSGSSITPTVAMEGYVFDGFNYSIVGNGQNYGGATIINAHSLSGVFASTGEDIRLQGCEINGATTLHSCHAHDCDISTTVTLGIAGDYEFVNCQSTVPGGAAPTIDLGAAIGATGLSLRRWSGGLTLLNVKAGDTVSVDAVSGGTITVNGTGGTVHVRGMVALVDSSGGAVTIVSTQAINQSTIATPTNITAGTVTTVSGNVTGSVGSVVGLTASNLDATVSSRLATAGYTAPPSAATVASAIWNETLSSHIASGSTGEAVTLLLGLSRQNFILDNTVYNSKGVLTSGRMRIFPTKVDTNAETNVLATYTVTGTAKVGPDDFLGDVLKIVKE
jgi:hypothetical protein